MRLQMDDVASAWVRLGVFLNAEAGPETPDLERLLLDTVRHAHTNVRLFTLAGTWLRECRDYLVGRRLRQIVLAELEAEYRPTLGMLLEWAYGSASTKAVSDVIELCRQSVRKGRPLASVEDRSEILRKLARERATGLSCKWGLWASAAVFETKTEAVRAVEWVAAHNPRLARRAGQSEVAAYILAEWAGREVESVAEIARRAEVTPLAAVMAVKRLRLAGWAKLRHEGRRTAVAIAA